MNDTAITPEMTLREAGPLWLESRKGFICDRTIIDYGWHLKRLYGILGRKRLDEITANDVRAFQQEWLKTAGAYMINKETSCLQQILKRVKLWGAISDDYQPLPLPDEPRGRALSDQEEYRLFSVGALNPNWEVCYNVALLSAHTAAGPGEIRHLRLKDVYLGDGDYKRAWIKISEAGAKNKFRLRTLPLDKEAYQALEALYRIGTQRGSHAQEHFLLPRQFQRSGNGRSNRADLYDPTRPVLSFKTAWREMTAAADIEGLRIYDLRHHALTRLAERNPEHVVLKIAGHCSPQMRRKVYAHVRDNAVREAMDSLSRADGWKPKEATVRKLLMPSGIKFDRAKVVSTVQKAKQIKAETALEDTSWIDLAGGE
jgi:integrase